MQAAALAAAEGVDVFLLVGYREEEFLQILHGGDTLAGTQAYVLGYLGNGVDYTLVVVESNALLAIVAEAHGGADVPAAAVGGYESLQQFHESRFAHAVGPDYAHAVVAGEGVVEIAQYNLVAKSLADASGFENLAADVARITLEFNVAFLQIHA